MHLKFTKDFDVIVCLYKNDMLTFSTNMIAIVEAKRYLTSIFKMKDRGELDIILDIKVKKHNSGYVRNQLYDIEKIINKFKHLNINGFNNSSVKLNNNCDKIVAHLKYTSTVGCLMYAMYYTR